jgi:hypothetical protein
VSSRRVAIDVEARTRALTDPPAWSAELAWLLGVIATDGNLGLVSLGLTPRKSLTLGVHRRRLERKRLNAQPFLSGRT